MKLQLYNTLSRKKESFKPIHRREVGVYTCGPTVYWFAHVGNMRAYLFADVLRRVLEHNGFKVKHVMNVTDVGHLTSDGDVGEDKMEKAAVKEGKTAREIAKFYFDAFVGDFKKLNILSPWKWVWASEHIKEQIALVKKLEKKGYTYETNDGIYFDSSKFKNYAKLGKLNIVGLQSGKRVGKGEKKHSSDFALWKFSLEDGKRQQEWESPWGLGFPGWHLECSAMSIKYLGEHFDIHTGGEDHVPIHHTNEIAQSESATGKKFVNYWLHNAFLKFGGKKVSKSKGGLYSVSELENLGYSALDFRYLSLMTHYRKPLNFSLDNLEASKNALDRMKRKVVETRKQKYKGDDFTKEYGLQFLKAVNDDLNMPQALQVVWKMLDDFDFEPKKKIVLLEKFDDVLGLGVGSMREEKVEVPVEIREMVDEREKLRKEKKFVEADIVRNKLKEGGWVLEDGGKGVEVRRV
ncbi:MAG: cysteine--tRNA ligase [archaeon]